LNTSLGKAIIEPVERDLIVSELTKDRFVRNSSKGGYEIYIVNAHNAPHTLREIGRLRELAFRASGGGTGEALDIDDYDLSDNCYQQLIVFDQNEKEVVGGYRYIYCLDVISPQQSSIPLSTAHYFHFSDTFRKEYLPYTIELGRSWVQPKYQPSVDPRRGIFALFSLWDGLGALVKIYPESKYFFGKVTMYPDYNSEARDLLLAFMHHYFPDPDDLVQPIHPLAFNDHQLLLEQEFNLPFKEGIKLLKKKLKELGESIPPLINLYMGLSDTMKTFGTALNSDFGDVEETGILVTMKDIYENSRSRHIDTFELPPDFTLTV